MADDRKKHSTGEEDRLREDIDSGRTGDKATATDPATAPLGTDAEAAGVITDPEAAAAAHRLEAEKGGTETVDAEAGRPVRRTGGFVAGNKLGTAIIVLFIAVLILWWIL